MRARHSKRGALEHKILKDDRCLGLRKNIEIRKDSGHWKASWWYPRRNRKTKRTCLLLWFTTQDPTDDLSPFLGFFQLFQFVQYSPPYRSVLQPNQRCYKCLQGLYSSSDTWQNKSNKDLYSLYFKGGDRTLSDKKTYVWTLNVWTMELLTILLHLTYLPLID